MGIIKCWRLSCPYFMCVSCVLIHQCCPSSNFLVLSFYHAMPSNELIRFEIARLRTAYLLRVRRLSPLKLAKSFASSPRMPPSRVSTPFCLLYRFFPHGCKVVSEFLLLVASRVLPVVTSRCTPTPAFCECFIVRDV